MDCISCHDGARHLEPLNLYLTGKKRSEFHQQAAFWARLNMAPLNMTTGNAVLNDAESRLRHERRCAVPHGCGIALPARRQDV